MPFFTISRDTLVRLIMTLALCVALMALSQCAGPVTAQSNPAAVMVR